MDTSKLRLSQSLLKHSWVYEVVTNSTLKSGPVAYAVHGQPMNEIRRLQTLTKFDNNKMKFQIMYTFKPILDGRVILLEFLLKHSWV